MTPSAKGAASAELPQTPENKESINEDAPITMCDEESVILNNDRTMHN